jgi:hypothetical protein
MKVETNAEAMFVTYDDETKTARVITADGFSINEVEDDSSWDSYEGVENVEEWLGVDYNDPDAAKIVEEKEV